MKMETKIISHDIENAKATIEFKYGDITYINNYDITCLVPGTKKVFEDLGLPFDETAQLRSIAFLERNMLSAMQEGHVQNYSVLNPVVPSDLR